MLDVSEGEMRWQIYTSLALGAKGVLYFCYWSPINDHTFLRGQAIMTPRAMELGKAPTIDQQVPSQKYPIVQRLNSKLKVLGNFLLKKDSSAVLQLHGGAEETRQIEHPVLTAINGTQVRHAFSLSFSHFSDKKTTGLGKNAHGNSQRRMVFLHRRARHGSSSSGSSTATRQFSCTTRTQTIQLSRASRWRMVLCCKRWMAAVALWRRRWMTRHYCQDSNCRSYLAMRGCSLSA